MGTVDFFKGIVDVLTARQKSYAPPKKNFERIARLWSVIFGIEITPKQVGLAMIALKITREMNAHDIDNLADICGYADCIRTIEEEK